VPLPISRTIEIPDKELTLAFVRSSGPGGQNVNKVATAVQLRFDLAGSTALSPEVKARLRAISGRRLTADGALLIAARNHRTQEQNRREAHARLAELVRRALVAPKARQATAPTRAARERRLEGKSRQQRVKRLRARPRWDD
jgi:ribosome-associated protein